MNIDNIAIILLLVIPGILLQNISKNFKDNYKKEKTEFRDMLNGVIGSIPIGILSIIIYSNCKKIYNLKELLETLYELKNLLVFIGILAVPFLIISVIYIFYIIYLRDIVNCIKNKIRRRIGLLDGYSNNPWELFINKTEGYRFYEIIYEDKSIKGFVKDYCTEEEGIMTLEIDKMYHDHEEFNIDEMFTDVIETYINPYNGI